MSIESYDSSEFMQRDDLLPYKSLLAQEAPHIKGKSMGHELIEMDRSEYSAIKSEEDELRVILDKEWTDYARNGLMGFLAASIAGIAIGFFNFIDELFLGSIVVGSLSVLGLMVITGSGPGSEVRKKIREIYDNRLSRLNTKCRVLEEEILKTNDPIKKEEFNLAKDFFKNRYTIYLAEKNRPITHVTVLR